MRIFIQTADETKRRPPCEALSAATLAFVLLGDVGSAGAQTGQIRCVVTENGSPAVGTVVLEQEGREVAGGSCSGTLAVPSGEYRATVRVDGVLDNPAKSVRVRVEDGQTAPLSVDFETGVVEVRIQNQGKAGTAIVSVSQLGKRIGTLGIGVATHLSTGRYEVVVRLDGKERRYSLDLKPGQRRLIRAEL